MKTNSVYLLLRVFRFGFEDSMPISEGGSFLKDTPHTGVSRNRTPHVHEAWTTRDLRSAARMCRDINEAELNIYGRIMFIVITYKQAVYLKEHRDHIAENL